MVRSSRVFMEQVARFIGDPDPNVNKDEGEATRGAGVEHFACARACAWPGPCGLLAADVFRPCSQGVYDASGGDPGSA